ncbi:MAG: hypothetical protein JWP91_1504 [Fibrobacteres bacterium]|nr:hypothetical protein [Fibrobacterota bacterium]
MKRVILNLVSAGAAGLLAAMGTAGAQARLSLFDGKSLAGWHTQGEGVWTVSGGAIHARNPKKDWAHLISDQTYRNGYVRFRFLNKAGNSGLYVRGAEGGNYGVKGMQVDLGAPHNDGSVMRVTDSAFAWYAEITKAADSGWLKPADWNELAVDVQESGLKTYINGRLIWSGSNLAGMAATGVLALQLHSGDDNDIAFKDLEILTPTRIPYCPVPGDPAHRPGNDPDSALCAPVGIRPAARLRPAASPEAAYLGSVFDLRGARLPAHPSPTRNSP